MRCDSMTKRAGQVISHHSSPAAAAKIRVSKAKPNGTGRSGITGQGFAATSARIVGSGQPRYSTTRCSLLKSPSANGAAGAETSAQRGTGGAGPDTAEAPRF